LLPRHDMSIPKKATKTFATLNLRQKTCNLAV